MAIILKRSEYPAISESGCYAATILDVTACKTRKNEEKIILTIQPRNFETQEIYRRMEIWLDNDGDIDRRINALSNALMEGTDDVEAAVGEEVGIVVKINTVRGAVYANVVNFFEIDSDSVMEEDEEAVEEDDEDEDADYVEDDEFTEENIQIKHSQAKYVSPPRRLNSRR